MIPDDKKKALARYRLQQAQESLEEAYFLFNGGKSLRSVANRLYYGMFYAVLALLIYEPYASSKHSGVLAYFNFNPSCPKGPKRHPFILWCDPRREWEELLRKTCMDGAHNPALCRRCVNDSAG